MNRQDSALFIPQPISIHPNEGPSTGCQFGDCNPIAALFFPARLEGTHLWVPSQGLADDFSQPAGPFAMDDTNKG